MGTRPYITVRVSGAAFFSSNGRTVTNIANLLGAADGANATFACGNDALEAGDVYRITFPFPRSIDNAIIDAFEYTFRSISAQVTGGADQVGLNLQPYDNTGTGRGQAEGTHEFFDTPVDRGSTTFIYPIGPDGLSLFGGSSTITSANAALGQNILTFSQLGGLAVNSIAYSGDSVSSPTITVDSLDLKVYYTPVDPGATIVPLDLSACAEATAATVGVAIGAGETEVAWSNASAGLVIQTGTTATDRASAVGATASTITNITAAASAVVTSAGHGLSTGNVISINGTDSNPNIDGERTVTVIDANTFSVPVTTIGPGSSGEWVRADRIATTRFLRYTIPTNKLGTNVNAKPNQLRLRLRMRVRDQSVWFLNLLANNPEEAVAFVDEFLLTLADGTILAQMDAAKDVYGSLTWPLAMFCTDHASAERDKIIAMDISGLTVQNLTDLNTNGGFIAIRFRMPVASNDNGPDWADVLINGASATMSFGTADTGAEEIFIPIPVG